MRLRDLGFPESKKDGSLYYITPTLKIKAENVVYLQSEKEFGTFEGLIFEPSLKDLFDASQSHFVQVIASLQSGVFAYSDIQLPTDGTTDPFLRAGSRPVGQTSPSEGDQLTDEIWLALANLWIEVKSRENRTIDPSMVEQSENKVDTVYVQEKEV